MRKTYFAVIGDPIGHTLSPTLHEMFARQCGIDLMYDKLQVPPEFFEETVFRFFDDGGSGLNVTAPYKEQAFKLAGARSRASKHAQAANTLFIHPSNKLYADNTDGIGLTTDLARYLDLKQKKVLLVGTGGAARGVIQALLGAGIDLLVIAGRNPEKLLAFKQSYPEIDIAMLDEIDKTFDLVINATSASLKGEVPNLKESCIKRAFCYDMVYDRISTPFLNWSLTHGAIDAVDGKGMLVEQAAASFVLWHHIQPDTESVLDALTMQAAV